MSLRTRTLLILAMTLTLALVCLTFVISSIVDQKFTALEQRKVQENVRRIELALENLNKQLASKTTDWAQWDDTYQFMADKNEEYLHSNISFETLSAISVGHVVYRDEEGNLVRGFEVKYDEESVGDLSPDAMKVFGLGNRSLPGKTPEATKTGVLLVNQQPYIFASIPIFDSRRAEQCRGSLLFSIPLDQKLIETIAEQTRLDVSLLTISDFRGRQPSAEPALLQSAEPLVKNQSNDEVNGYEVLRDADGTPIRVIAITLQRDIFQQGQEATQFLIWSILGVMMVSLVVSGLSLNRWVLSRLSNLQREVSEIDPVHLNGKRVSMGGRDELTSLGNTFNTFLSALEDGHNQLIDARGIAERANAAKSMFIARVSHELRTPIAGIIGLNQMLLKRPSESRAIRELLTMQGTAAEGLLTIINEILDFSTVEQGKLTFEKIPFNITDVVRETLQISEGRLEVLPNRDTVEILCEIAPNVPNELDGDPTKLKQVLVNLLGNAIKFTDRGFVGLRISATTQTNREHLLSFEVWDTGIGISPSHLESIFEPFTQADETVTRKYKGTGLGLTVVRQITEMLNGNVIVESVENQGSRFIVSIPYTLPTNIENRQQPIAAAFLPRTIHLVGQHSRENELLYHGLSERGLKPIWTEVIETSLFDPTKDETLIVISEDVLLRSSTIEDLKKHLPTFQGCLIGIVRSSNLELRETIYSIGCSHLLSRPVLIEDLLNEFRKLKTPIIEAVSSSSPQAPLTKKLRVLLADDTSTNRIIVESLLTEEGHSVVSVGDGQELLNRLTPMLQGTPGAERFDVVLTDIAMPVMDGFSATEAIRALEKANGNQHLPIIAITAHIMQEEQMRMKAAGMDDIITKPIRPTELATIFSKLI